MTAPFIVSKFMRVAHSATRRVSIGATLVRYLCTSYNGLYGEAPPEKGTFFRLRVSCRREGISQVEVYKRVGKSVI